MQAAQRQTQRETRRQTLGLFRDTPVWDKPASIAVSAKKQEIKSFAQTERDSIPALLPKERDSCNRATD